MGFTVSLELWTRRSLAVCAIVLLASQGSFPSAFAATVTTCTSAELAAAIAAGGEVKLSCDGTIVITNTLIVSTNLTLDATEHGVTISTTNDVRLFLVKPQATLTLKNIGLANGREGDSSTNAPPGRDAKGGAIYNEGGVVRLLNCTLSRHRVSGNSGANGADAASGPGANGTDGGIAGGGAIYNDGGLVFATNTIFLANQATGGPGGNGGHGGTAGNGGNGGRGGNAGGSFGGAIFNTPNGTLQLFDCTFSSNQVSGAVGGIGGVGGGALGFEGAHGAASSALGGGVFNLGGKLSVVNCTFVFNGCTGASGVIGSAGRNADDGAAGLPGSHALGAALANSGGIVALTNCTVFGNIVVGGDGGDGGAGGTSGFGGDGGAGGAGGDGRGAGLYNTLAGTVTVVNCTIAKNVARAGIGGAAGPGGGALGRSGSIGSDPAPAGAGVFNADGAMRLKNSILSNDAKGGNGGGVITDGGNNFSSDSTPAFSESTSRNKIDARLMELADNGGRTQTLALQSDSPAIDAGDDSAAPLADQRHARRTGQSDVGAVEWNGALPEFLLEVFRPDLNSILLVWPVSSFGLILESADSLSTSATWSAVLDAPEIVVNQYKLTISVLEQSRYYRLRRP